MQKPGLFGMNGLMLFVLILFTVAARAQQPGYLILIDADNKQPFTVRMGDQLYASSGHGHLVLSRLKDSSYRLNVRFPKNNLAEQVFPVVIKQKDQGFQLKGADSAWTLYNWQSKEVIRPVFLRDSSRMLEKGVKRNDGFSRLMAAVVNDTSVMYNTYTGESFSKDTPSLVQQRGKLPPSTQVAKTKIPVAPGNKNSKTNVPVATEDQPSGVTTATLTAAAATTKTAAVPAEAIVKEDKIPSPAPVEKKPVAESILPPAEATGNRLSAKDSAIASRNYKDSVNKAYKTAVKDSLILVKKAIYSRDSLAKAMKAAYKDSIQTAKRLYKDSIRLAKTDRSPKNQRQVKDSLLAVARQAAIRDSLMTVAREKAVQDSLFAIQKEIWLKDSMQIASTRKSLKAKKQKYVAGVKKVRDVSLKISRKVVFVDISKDGYVDSITAFIYFETPEELAATRPAVIKKQGIPVIPSKAQSSGDTLKTQAAAAKSRAQEPGYSTCSQVATPEEAESLRSGILKLNSEEEKIALATTAFTQRCYSVGQIRELAALFVSDKARYRLMDAAHTHIADREHFRELADMYTDKNFQRKFLAMAEKGS